MTIKEKLELIKRLSGKTQEKLAAELGVSFPTLNSWINGKSDPRADAEKRIEELYLHLTGQNVVAGSLIEGKKQGILTKRREFSKILQLLKDRKDLYDQYLLSLTYNTNRLEGSSLTEPETSAILFQNAALPDKSIIEQMEVKNHQAAFGYMMRSLSEKKDISEEFICKMHSVLMNGIREDAGYYRNHGVRITGSNVVTANCLKVPELMKGLMEDIAAGNADIIGFAVKIHSRFEQIHPFSDGNGRVGRLLLTSMMLKEGLPPAIISQAQRRFYILYLNQSQIGGDYSRLENFISDAVLSGYDVLKKV